MTASERYRRADLELMAARRRVNDLDVVAARLRAELKRARACLKTERNRLSAALDEHDAARAALDEIQK